MKKLFILPILAVLFLSGCSEDKKEIVVNEPEVINETIENNIDNTNNEQAEVINENIAFDLENKVKLFSNKILEICSNYPSFDDYLTKGDFDNVVSLYKGITELKTNGDEVELFYREMDNIIGNSCMNNWDNFNMGNMAEQIRRNDPMTYAKKEELTQKFLNLYLTPVFEELYNSDNITKEQFLTSTLDFISENPLYDIFSLRYNWNKATDAGLWYKPSILEKGVVKKLEESFNKILEKYGMTQEDYATYLYKQKGVENIFGLKAMVEDLYMELDNQMGLKDVILTTREFTKEERKEIFSDVESFENKLGIIVTDENNKNRIKELRLLMYYIIYLGQEHNFDSSQVRVDTFKNGAGIQNLFRISRYINESFFFSIEPRE